MDEILDILLIVQNLDDKIKDSKSKIEKIPHKIGALEKEIEKAKYTLQEKNDRVKELKKTYKIKEGDIVENENKIKKLNSQTFLVKTNEEYRAIITEIEYLKKENKKTEDAMIAILEEEEQLQNAMSTLEKETEDFIEKKTSEIDNLKKVKEELVERQEQAQHSFEENFNKLSNDIKEVYTRISKVRDRVVCTITDTTCTGCYANLTFQCLNELKEKSKLMLCDNCGRILIYVAPTK